MVNKVPTDTNQPIRKKKPVEKWNLPDKQWVIMSLDEIPKKSMRHLFKIYELSYHDIGLTVKDIKHMKNKYKISMLTNIDKDPEPDCFMIFRETQSGNKIALMGTDGKQASKTAIKTQLAKVLRKRSEKWYAEASHGVARSIQNRGIKPVEKESHVKEVLSPHKIRWVGKDGKYERKIEGLEKPITKQLFGKYALPSKKHNPKYRNTKLMLGRRKEKWLKKYE